MNPAPSKYSIFQIYLSKNRENNIFYKDISLKNRIKEGAG